MFVSKKSLRKVPFKFEISPELEARIEEVKTSLKELDPDMEYKPEIDLTSALEKSVSKAEKEVDKMIKSNK